MTKDKHIPDLEARGIPSRDFLVNSEPKMIVIPEDFVVVAFWGRITYPTRG